MKKNEKKRKMTLSRMIKQVNAGHSGNGITKPSRTELPSVDGNHTTTEIPRPKKRTRRTEDDIKLLYNNIKNDAIGKLESKGVAKLSKQSCCSILWVWFNTFKRETTISAKEAKDDLIKLIDATPNWRQSNNQNISSRNDEGLIVTYTNNQQH